MSGSEEELEEGTENPFYKPSYVLVAIDTAPCMFVKPEGGGSTPFRVCLNACYDLANSLIFTQNKRSWSPFGITLANEDALAAFVNFNENILDVIKFLKGKKGLTDDQLSDSHQRKGGLDLSSFFLYCKKKFKEVKSEFYKRSIIFITNEEDPVNSDKSQRFAALNEAKNFEDNGIHFEMVTMKENFDYKIFYNELFSLLKTSHFENLIEDEDGLLEKLSSLILVRYYQRKLLLFPFLGDDTRFLKVKQKKIVQEEKLNNNKFFSKSGKQLKQISKQTEDGAKKFVLKGHKEVLEFDSLEKDEIKNNSLPVGYTLLHVSNRVTEVGMVLTDIGILERDQKEDLPFFEQFWQFCVEKDKVLVCVRKLKESDKIRFVELIPKFANNMKIFIVKAIPFNDEYKHPPVREAAEENLEYTEEEIQVTNNLINKLTFDYNPKMFCNPSIAKKKAYLRSKLLEETPQEVEDVTLDEGGIDKSLGDLGKSFNRLFDLNEEATEPAQKRRKRK